MSNFLICISVLFFAAWFGVGIRWGFWIWDNLGEMLRDFLSWLSSRRKKD